MPGVIDVKNLEVCIDTYRGRVFPVRDVSFLIEKGQIFSLVGESGCGKSTVAKTLMRLNPEPPTHINSGSIIFEDKDIVKLSEKELKKIRGNGISMIFQDPMTCLNPTMTVGNQIIETLRNHEKISPKDAWNKSVELLTAVGIPDPESRMREYPHEFSGGMRQRAMIAMALACNSSLLIADEPTTALDVTIQAQILELLKELQKKTGIAILLITHDLGVVANMADVVGVMYAGQIVEMASCMELFTNPIHPYTKSLLKAKPRVDQDRTKPLDSINGMPPSLLNPPEGCAFFERCKECSVECEGKCQVLKEVKPNHFVRCKKCEVNN